MRPYLLHLVESNNDVLNNVNVLIVRQRKYFIIRQTLTVNVIESEGVIIALCVVTGDHVSVFILVIRV